MPAAPSVGTLSAIKLKTEGGDDFSASEIWKDGPAVIVVLRRPGCMLCREQALKVMDIKPKLDELGVKSVVLFHEWIQREIDAFRPKFWKSDVYYDFEKGFYKALGGGKIRKGSLGTFLNPFSRFWKNARRALARVGDDHNLKGDGLTMGGLFVIGKGNTGVEYMFLEQTFGDHAPVEELLQAAENTSETPKAN